jgi:WD40 repeat protein
MCRLPFRVVSACCLVGVLAPLALGGCGRAAPTPAAAPDAPPGPAADAGSGSTPVAEPPRADDAGSPAGGDRHPDASAVGGAGGAGTPDAAAASCTGWAVGLRALASAPSAHLIAAGYQDGSVTIWNGDLTLQRQIAAHTAPVRALVLASDGSLLVTVDAHPAGDSSVAVWSVADGRSLWTSPPAQDPNIALALSPDNRLVLAASDHQVRIYDVDGRKLAWSLDSPDDLVRVAFFADAGATVFVKRDSGITVHLRGTGAVVRRKARAQLGEFVDDSSIPSPGGDLLVGRNGPTTRLIVMRTADLSPIDVPASAQGHPGYPLAFSADGSTLVTAGFDDQYRETRVPWRTSDWTPLPAWTGAPPALLITAGPHGQDLLVTDAVGRVRLVDAATGQSPLPAIAGRGQILPIVGLRFSPDATLVASQSHEHSGRESAVMVWSAAARTEVYSLQDVSASTDGHAFSPDGQFLFVATSAGAIRVHRAGDGTVVRQFGSDVSCVVPAPDGQVVYACGNDRSLRSYRVADGAARMVAMGLSFVPGALAISPGGDLIAASGMRGRVSVHHAADGSFAWADLGVNGPTDQRSSLAFSPDGKILVVKTGHDWVNLYLFNATSGTPIPLPIPFDTRGTVDISPDGRLLAVGAGPGVQLIRLSDQKLVHTVAYAGHPNSLMGVAFSPVRDQLIVGLDHGRIDSHCGLIQQFGTP